MRAPTRRGTTISFLAGYGDGVPAMSGFRKRIQEHRAEDHRSAAGTESVMMEVVPTTITSEDALRELIGEPADIARAKVSDRVNDLTRRFIDLSPFMLLATSAPDGSCDVSPRGDPAGFVHVVDERTLLVPDRPGNRLADSLRNILQNPHVGLLFLVPGVGDTLRVNGRATIVTDPELLEPLAVEGKTPKLGLLIEVDEVFTHCSKAFLRSRSGIRHGYRRPQRAPELRRDPPQPEPCLRRRDATTRSAPSGTRGAKGSIETCSVLLRRRCRARGLAARGIRRSQERLRRARGGELDDAPEGLRDGLLRPGTSGRCRRSATATRSQVGDVIPREPATRAPDRDGPRAALGRRDGRSRSPCSTRQR